MIPLLDPNLWVPDPGLQGYLAALAPLAAALLAVPTLEEARRGELVWPRPVVLEPAELWQAHRQLSLTEASLREGRWWTLISYMFLHQDEAHLAGNLASIFASGREVYRHVGFLGFYGVFFAAGAAAGANRWGRLLQMEAQLAGSAPRLPPSVGEWVPERLRQIVDAGITKAAKSTAPIINEFAADMGASGGACGVMGFSLGLALERILAKVGLLPWRTDRAAAAGSTGAGDLFAVLVALDCGHFLLREWRLLSGRDGVTGVGHASHLTGFAVGLGLLAALRLAEDAGGGEERWPRPPPADGEGRARPGRRFVDSSGLLL